MSTPTEYVLGTHAPERDRLETQHGLWLDEAQRAWDAIGARPGARVLDVGCGPGLVTEALAERVAPGGCVTGLERSPAFTQQARERCARLGDAASIIEFDVMQTPLPDHLHGTMDAAWIRWLLMFLPDPGRALALVRDALRPGGLVAIHEYVDYGTYGLLRDGPRIAQFVQHAIASFSREGGDANVARHLPSLLAMHGFDLVSARPIARIATPNERLWQWPAGFIRTYAPRLVELGFADQAWLEATLAELTTAERDPSSMLMCPTLLELVARRR